MDDILDFIRDRTVYYNTKTEGTSPKESTTRKTVIFKRIYTIHDFKKMINAIKSIYDKEVYNKIKNEYKVEFVYPMDLNINPGDMNPDDTYELIIDVVDSSEETEEIKSIMYKVLPKFRKLGMPFEVVSDKNKLFFHSKVVFQVV